MNKQNKKNHQCDIHLFIRKQQERKENIHFVIRCFFQIFQFCFVLFLETKRVKLITINFQITTTTEI